MTQQCYVPSGHNATRSVTSQGKHFSFNSAGGEGVMGATTVLGGPSIQGNLFSDQPLHPFEQTYNI